MGRQPPEPLRGPHLLVEGLILLGLLAALAVGIAPNASTALRQYGESTWEDYAARLRVDPEPPDCDPDALEERLLACPAEAAPQPAPAAEDPFGGDDPFAEPDPEPAGGDPFGGDDPFAEPDPEPAGGDPFGGEDPFAEPQPASAENCPALRTLHAECVASHERYRDTLASLTPGVRRFRAVDRAVSSVADFPWWRHLLSLLLLLGGLAATTTRMHIALRDARTLAEHRLSQAAQLLAHLFLVASAVADWRVQMASSAELEHLELPVIWGVGFAALAAVNLYHLLRPPSFDRTDTGPARLLMVIPLYAYMACIAGGYFLLAEGHPSGQAIYLHKFVQHPSVYIGIGLYIWAGMLLAQTRIAHRLFGLVRPWRLPPAVFAWIVVVAAAVPTAYSGASGIFVIAAGAVIFEQLREAGASKRLALATTAMSGSLGVVLRPCLVVVLIAVLNKEVTTDDLFSHGLLVFALTAGLFLGAMLLRNREGWHVRPPRAALPEAGRAAKGLLPHLVLGGLVLAGFALLLETGLDEFTAPYLLPVLLLPLVAWDRFRPPAEAPAPEGTVAHGLFESVQEASHHVGALLLVMAGSVGFGGVVERARVMALVPDSLGSLPLTMAVLVVMLVLVGMTMDALGAVILVSVTLAEIARANGVDPIHFWMTVLVAFELGYLTPPVALNHLLARQVIGPEASVEDDATEGFWARWEHIWLPMAVMGTALVIVAFGPLAFYGAP